MKLAMEIQRKTWRKIQGRRKRIKKQNLLLRSIWKVEMMRIHKREK